MKHLALIVFTLLALSVSLAFCQQRSYFDYEEPSLIHLPSKYSTLSSLEKLYSSGGSLEKVANPLSNPTNFERMLKNRYSLQKRPIFNQWGPNGEYSLAY